MNKFVLLKYCNLKLKINLLKNFYLNNSMKF